MWYTSTENTVIKEIGAISVFMELMCSWETNKNL